MAIQVGCDSLTNGDDQLSCLQAVPFEDISANSMTGFTANVDGGFTSVDPFIPVACEETVAHGNYNTNVDLMIGVTEDEGLLSTMSAYTNSRLV